MDISVIKENIKNGSIVLHNGKLYSKNEFNQIKEAMEKVSHYDLLQNTKKIQL